MLAVKYGSVDFVKFLVEEMYEDTEEWDSLNLLREISVNTITTRSSAPNRLLVSEYLTFAAQVRARSAAA